MKKVIISASVAAVAILSSCGTTGTQGGVTKSADFNAVVDAAKMDSLSYALGTDVGLSISQQMSDIPLNIETLEKGIEEAAFAKSELSEQQSIETLQNYFTQVRPARLEIVNKKRNEADSIAYAAGTDSATVIAARAALKADADMFENEAQREDVSYAFGVNLGNYLKNIEVPVDLYWFVNAINSAYEDKALLSREASTQFLQNYFTVVLPQERLAISEEAMAKIATESGVKKTESGILYRIVEEGDMAAAAKADEDVIKVNYTGRLVRNMDKVFDTSRYADRSEEQQNALKEQDPTNYKEDKPIEFALNRVIPGWTEGMKLVGKGGRIELWIPAELAYGARGTGRDIGPNDAIYFDVEVLDVTPATAAEEAAPAAN